MEHHLEPLNAISSINAFQWCKTKLSLKHPRALATVERFEADSKFFRGLMIVVYLLIPIAAFQGETMIIRLLIVIIGIALFALAFWRYVDQRVKAINQAYWFII